MFKKFERKDVSGFNQVKSSDFRKIRKSIAESYPAMEEHLDIIFPKKAPLMLAKCVDNMNLIADEHGFVWFMSDRKNGWYAPSLRCLHKFPEIMPKLQVDRGAIPFVMKGANIMCPGLTSAGGRMDDVDQGEICAIMAEGKELALAIGITTMSSADIKSVNKGIGVEVVHYLNDGLWKLPVIE